MVNYYAEAEGMFEYSQDLRRDFHQHPELGFQEVRTAGIVARELKALGLEVTTKIAETGVVALLKGTSPGPVGLMRFDMDALPITEETGAEYASQNPGVMHACGHDGHTAIGLTVARLLHIHREDLSGTIKLVFQPAEEGLGGAQRMVADGVLENPTPDFSLGMHLWNEKPVGWLGITPGPLMAASELFDVRITGKGGHGASPHQTIDPVFAASQVISALQSIVSRNVHPLESAVVSVTSVSSGEAHNVIPPIAELKGTIRTFKPDVRDMVLTRFREIVTGVCQAMDCQVEIVLEDLTPAVVNDPKLTTRVQGIAREVFPEFIQANSYLTMGSEDMAFMMDDLPGCYLFVGSANHEKDLDAKHHHPRFDFDEDVLPRAATLMATVATELLRV